jgi:hypothetical protein
MSPAPEHRLPRPLVLDLHWAGSPHFIRDIPRAAECPPSVGYLQRAKPKLRGQLVQTRDSTKKGPASEGCAGRAQ